MEAITILRQDEEKELEKANAVKRGSTGSKPKSTKSLKSLKEVPSGISRDANPSPTREGFPAIRRSSRSSAGGSGQGSGRDIDEVVVVE